MEKSKRYYHQERALKISAVFSILSGLFFLLFIASTIMLCITLGWLWIALLVCSIIGILACQGIAIKYEVEYDPTEFAFHGQ